MEKINANGKLYLPLLVIFLAMLSMVGAIDLIFCLNPDACDGDGHIFTGIPEGICCNAKYAQGSVLFSYMDDCKGGVVFGEESCAGYGIKSGVGNSCLVGGSILSAYWFQLARCKRSALLADNDVASDRVKCQGVAEPTGIVFTEDAQQGTWVLTTRNAVELTDN